MQRRDYQVHLIGVMKKSKIISLLLIMSMFAFLMETEKEVRNKYSSLEEMLTEKISSDSTHSEKPSLLWKELIADASSN